jgi:hypothetical protein
MNFQNKFNTIALRIQDTLAGLGDRDRKLLIGLSTAAFIGMLSGGVFWMKISIDAVNTKVEFREEALETAIQMAEEFQSNEDTAQRIAETLETHKTTNLSAFLEKAAQSVGIADRLDSVKASSTSVNGDLEETIYAAQFSKLSLEDATAFLFEIETSGFPLVVKTARFKTRRRKGAREIKLSLDIAAYKSIAAEEGGEG